MCRYPEGQKLWENNRIPMEQVTCPEVGDIYVGRSSVVTPFASAQQDVSHWDKVKVLLNRIRWRSPQHPEPPAPPDGSGPR